MTHVRYKKETFTPGERSLGKPVIKRSDETVDAEWARLQARRRELEARLVAVKNEQAGILENLGCWVAENCDWKEHTDNLAALRSEAEAIQAGINYLSNKIEMMKRVNNWL